MTSRPGVEPGAGPDVEPDVEPDVVAQDDGAEVPEGVRWDGARERLLWVDVTAGLVHALRPADGHRELWRLGGTVGAVAPRAAGGLVAAAGDGFALLAEDAAAPATRLVAVTPPGVRMNDGACDASGRFWAGSMALDESPGRGALYRLEPDGRARRMLSGVTVSNGLGWSTDGRTMYYTDTATGCVDAFDVEPGGEGIRNRRTVIRVPGPAKPDGLTVDADGAVWVALWDGWAVDRYSPRGELLARVAVPAAQVTSCAFGGPGLRDLYVTTGAHRLTAAQRRAQPLAGAVLRFRTDCRGLPSSTFAG